MKWIVRGFLLVMTLMFLLLAGATYMLVTFNPNDYKAQIASAVTSATGRSFAIDGDITATLFPVLGFTAHGVTMGQPAGFGDGAFLSVGALTAGVKLQPLFDNRIELTKITLTEPAITIIKKADGTNNLTFPDRGGAQVTAQDDRPAMDLSFGAIEIQRARATYDDRAKNEKWVIDPLNMTLPGFRPGASTNIKIDMAMKRGDDMTMRIDAQAAMTATPDAGTFALNGAQAQIRLQSPALAQDMTVNLRGDMALDMSAETARIENLRATWQGTTINADVTVQNFKSPRLRFTAAAPSIDIDALTAAFAKADKGADKSANDRADILPFDLLRDIALDGTITIDNLKVAKLAASALNITMATNNGQLTLHPVTARLYDGTLDARIQVDARTNNPALSAAGTLTDVQVGPILKAQMGEDFLTGRAQFTFDLNGRGRHMAGLKSSAGGRFGFDFGEGYINKWQLSRRINQAIDWFETGQINDNAPDRIRFTALRGTFNGSNGVFRNDDLLLLAPKSHARGAGTVNFARDSVDYTLRVALGEDPTANTRHLPIRISGPLAQPQYAIDVQAIIGQQVEEKRDELINRALERIQGNRAAPAEGEAATGGEGGEAAPVPTPAPDPAEQLLRGLFGR